MRKLAIFSIFLMMFGVFSEALAAKNCRPFTCGKGHSGRDEVSSSASGYGGQCYYCNNGVAKDNQCDHGDIVASINERGDITKMSQCVVTTFKDTWNDYTPPIFCKKSDIQVGDPGKDFSNSEKVYSLDGGNKTEGYESGDDLVLRAGNTACVHIKCKDGYKPNNADITRSSACVEAGRDECEARSHMKWDGGKCVCKEAGKTESADKRRCVSDEDVCKEAGGEWNNNNCDCSKRTTNKQWDSATEKCVQSQAERDAANKRRQQQQQQAEQAKNVMDARNTIRGLCANIDELVKGYLTDAGILKLKTDADKICNGAYMTENNLDTLNGYITTLNSIISAINVRLELLGAEKVKAEQDEQERQRQQAEEAERKRQQQINITITRIQSSFKGIGDLQKSLSDDASVWKTAEGGFNTARLVSDSVAGVVLGTAGGLITSNVIKKNQIKGGFEDLSCTVGGQVVAGWGDEFSVGIR